MKRLEADHLATVCGGMQWKQFRPSTNVEDRRGLTRWQSLHVHPTPPPPLPRLVRTPGDLSSQLGLDDIDHLAQQLRRRRRR